MSLVEKVNNVLGDRKEVVVTMKLFEKKSLTKDVDKGTDELADMKQAVVAVRRKGLDQFEGQPKGSTQWFKLDSGFLKTTLSTIHSEFYKDFFYNIEDQDTELYTTFDVPFDEEFINTKNEKKDQT